MKPLVYHLDRALARACLLLGWREPALRLFTRMAAACPGERYPLASIAHVLAQAGRHHEALVACDALLKANAGDAEAWFNHGYLLEQLGRHQDAADSFQRATCLAPRFDLAWYGLGLSLIRLGQMDAAAAALLRNTELQPMSPFGWYQLARVKCELRRPEEAMGILNHLKGFEPRVAAQLEREMALLAAGTRQ